MAAAEPEAAVGRFLRREGRTLWVGHGPEAEAIDLDHSRVYLIAAGKAAIPMTAGVMAVLGADVAGGVVIAKAGGSEWPAAAAQWPLAVTEPRIAPGLAADRKLLVAVVMDGRFIQQIRVFIFHYSFIRILNLRKFNI